MNNFQSYVSVVNNITYRYEVLKSGSVFNVSIFNVIKTKHVEEGMKKLTNVTADDVIDECLSHYKKIKRHL